MMSVNITFLSTIKSELISFGLQHLIPATNQEQLLDRYFLDSYSCPERPLTGSVHAPIYRVFISRDMAIKIRLHGQMRFITTEPDEPLITLFLSAKNLHECEIYQQSESSYFKQVATVHNTYTGITFVAKVQSNSRYMLPKDTIVHDGGSEPLIALTKFTKVPIWKIVVTDPYKEYITDEYELYYKPYPQYYDHVIQHGLKHNYRSAKILADADLNLAHKKLMCFMHIVCSVVSDLNDLSDDAYTQTHAQAPTVIIVNDENLQKYWLHFNSTVDVVESHAANLCIDDPDKLSSMLSPALKPIEYKHYYDSFFYSYWRSLKILLEYSPNREYSTMLLETILSDDSAIVPLYIVKLLYKDNVAKYKTRLFAYAHQHHRNDIKNLLSSTKPLAKSKLRKSFTSYA